jgi:biopolymer transport protein ExbD
MVPLVDTVFIILVFFIYAMFSMSFQSELPVILPSSSASEIEKRVVLSVTVKPDGTIYVDKEQTSIDDLTLVLKNSAGNEKQAGVLLFADKSITYQKLFNVLDRIKGAGINKISLQAEADRIR